ncbi:sequestosome-1-like protein [Aphelenchoides avenae]|nr:sequestosome-1-like protein [Aphelenchus avenae]
MKELLPSFSGQLGYTDEEGDKVLLDSTRGLQYLLEINDSKWKSEKVLKLETLGAHSAAQETTQLDKPFIGLLPFKSPAQPQVNQHLLKQEFMPPEQGTTQPNKPIAGFLPFKPPPTQSQANPDLVLPEHFGIYCDNCKTANLKGMRLKCAVCDDYDLCSACGVKGVHEQHPMIRIWKPLLPVVGPELSNWLQRIRGELEQIINYKGDETVGNTGLPAP